MEPAEVTAEPVVEAVEANVALTEAAVVAEEFPAVSAAADE